MNNLKKMLQVAEKRERDGWPRLVPLSDIYGFEYFLTHYRPWRTAMTQGNELLHVYFGGREIIVWYDEKKGTRINCRRGMALWYAYETFHREKIKERMYGHESVDGDPGQCS